jgi:mannose-6-phosphate isomerase-like protein (cupin superfamily)
MRSVLALVLLVACSPAPPAAAPPPEPSAAVEAVARRAPLVHVDIPQKVAEGEGSFAADWSFDLVVDERFTAHVHVIPQEQLVPIHHHPKNDELVFVAGGRGEWLNATREEGVAIHRTEVTVGDAVISPRGVVHGVRNRHPEALATVVIQPGGFGQNWYLEADDVRSEGLSTRPMGGETDFAGWSVDWWDGGAQAGDELTRLYAVAEGQGSLHFEDVVLPLHPGVFVKIPASLEHRVEGGVRMLRVRVPPAN